MTNSVRVPTLPAASRPVMTTGAGPSGKPASASATVTIDDADESDSHRLAKHQRASETGSSKPTVKVTTSCPATCEKRNPSRFSGCAVGGVESMVSGGSVSGPGASLPASSTALVSESDATPSAASVGSATKKLAAPARLLVGVSTCCGLDGCWTTRRSVSRTGSSNSTRTVTRVPFWARAGVTVAPSSRRGGVSSTMRSPRRTPVMSPPVEATASANTTT